MIKRIKDWIKSLYNKKGNEAYHALQLEVDIDAFLTSFPKTRRIQLDLEDSLKFVQGETIKDEVLLEKYKVSKEDCAGVVFDLRLMVPQTKIVGNLFLDTGYAGGAKTEKPPRKIIEYPDGIRETIY